MTTAREAGHGPHGVSREAEPGETAPLKKGVVRDLLHGTSALGAGMIIERGFGFVANLLAARFGGASTFGAYSLGLSTANNIASYAAGGIGSTAVRFSARYPRESAGYRTLARVLAIISLVSSVLAAFVLWLGAAPLARLLGKDSLAGVLHWAALSAAGLILLECCRGFLVGQRRLPAILLLSATVGIGLLALVPAASRVGPVPMMASYGAITFAAVALCALFYRPLGLAPVPSGAAPEPVAPLLREVWSFGLVQLAGLVGINASAWWLTTVIARSDPSLVQIGFLAISHQLRNMAGLFPGLLTESSLAVMARSESHREKTPDQVMAVCTVVTTFVSLAVAALGIVLVPWVLSSFYGHAYSAAAAAASVALVTAVVHMGNAPAAARLSIVSIRTTGIVNAFWALVVASGATIFFFHGGNAYQGALLYLAGHLLSAALTLLSLGRKNCVPKGLNRIFVLSSFASLALVALALLRAARPDLTSWLTLSMALLATASLWALVSIGRNRGWLPSFGFFIRVLRSRGLFRPEALETPGSGFDA